MSGCCWVPGRLVDADVLADRLGVSTGHVRWLVMTGRVPHIEWGAGPRFDPAAIETWLVAHTHHPHDGPGTAVVVDLAHRSPVRRRALRLVRSPGADR